MISVLCLVGAHVDVLYRLRHPARPGLSVPSVRENSVGGCALNVAAGLSALGIATSHAGVRGQDSDGAAVAKTLRERGITDVGVASPDVATGHYAALLDPGGSLALATAAMGAYERAETLLEHAPLREAARRANAMVLDANAPPHTVERLAALRGPDTLLVLLATSADKVGHLDPVLGDAAILFANEGEWRIVAKHHDRIAHTVVTDGERGATLYAKGEIVGRHAAPQTSVADVVGAGDALCAGTLHAWLNGVPLGDAVENGMATAARCVERPSALGWLDTPNVSMRSDP